MAIDTRSKRVSALRKTLPFPDGIIAQGDRQHITWNYAGVLAEPLVPTEPMRVFTAVRNAALAAGTRTFVFPATTRGPFE